MLTCASIWRNHLLPGINRRGFVYLLEDIFPLKDHLGDFLLFWGPFFPPQWAVVYVLVLCHESRLSSPSCCWWTHECWPKPRSKEWRPPDSETDSLSSCFFFLYGLLLERFWQGANILEDSVPSQSSSTTCTERCWLETSWFLELLEWVFRLTGVNLIPQEKLHLKVKLHRSQSPAAEA